MLAFCAFSLKNTTALTRNDIVLSAMRPDAEEFIELKKLSQNSISLTGFSINYINGSGTENPIYVFSDGTEMTGESLLLRLSSTDSSDEADLTYSRNLSQTAGKIVLKFNGEIFDEICWGTFENCSTGKFSTVKKVLVRDFETFNFSFQEEYDPSWEAGREILKVPEIREEVPEPRCRGLQFSEILSYYESSKAEQFIEFFNSTATQINLEGCAVKYKNTTYLLEGIVEPEGYFVYYPKNFSLTKNPTSSNLIEILDTDGEVVDKLTYFNGQKKATSFAQFGYDANGKELWLTTFMPTPGEENDYQKYKTCAEGKVINEETGNCVKKTVISSELEACPTGSYRNPLTNRCKKYASTASAEIKPCAEGYERNPETNRCRKIVSNDGSDFALKTEDFEEKSSFIALWAIIGVGIIGAIYIIFEYRQEIKKLFKKK